MCDAPQHKISLFIARKAKNNLALVQTSNTIKLVTIYCKKTV
jgi:hypothetical protein